MDQKIKDAFSKVKKDIFDLRDGQIKIVNSINELAKQVHELSPRSSPRSSPWTTPQTSPQTTPQTSPQTYKNEGMNQTQKRVLISLDKVQLMSAISNLIDEGYKTTHMKEEIMQRFNIKRACFFNYLKLVREKSTIKSTIKSTNKSME